MRRSTCLFGVMTNRADESMMSLDRAVFEKFLASLPVVTRLAGETVLSVGLKTDLLLILKKGAVVVLKDSIEIARVVHLGAVLGELSALLDQPHTAEVRALEDSQFYVADAELLEKEPAALLYVAKTLAQRLVDADTGLVELKKQLQTGQPPSALGKTIEKLQEVLKVGWDVGPWIA
jgi:CRP/FNR family transcriptional regulator, cyclic AMP receptor protein